MIFKYFFGSPQKRKTACELVDLLLRAADGNAEILQRALRHLGHPPDFKLWMVSAWSAANGISLGQVKVDDKSNEITAVPLLIHALDLDDCIVTIDKKKFSVASVSGIAAAKKTLIESSVDLVLCDLRLPDGDGIDLLEWVSNRNVNVPLIVMTSYAAIPSAVQAMKLGARDYISKPVNPEDLLQKINEVFNAGVKTGKQIPVSESVPEETNYLEGQSEAARQLYTYVKLVAPTSMSVLINGASGTGKEYV